MLIDSEGFGMSTTWNDYITYGVFTYTSGVGGNGGPVQTGGMYGDNFLSLWNTNGVPQRTVPNEMKTFFFGARTRLNGGTGAAPGTMGYVFNDVSFNNQFGITFATDGTITISRGMPLSNWFSGYGTGGTIIGQTSPLTMPVNGWQYIEVGATIDAMVGSITVRVNGITVINLNGISTKGSSSISSTVRRIGCQCNGIGPGTEFHTQHWYICDNNGAAPWNSFLGDVRVQTLLPTANDAVQFAPVGFTNWQNAATVPPNPFVTYNSDSIAGEQDTFAMQPISTNMGVVYGVHTKPLIYKNDPGLRSGASVLKSGGTTFVGASTNLSETAAQLKTMYQTDPGTSVQWTPTAVNNMKAGYKVTE